MKPPGTRSDSEISRSGPEFGRTLALMIDPERFKRLHSRTVFRSPFHAQASRRIERSTDSVSTPPSAPDTPTSKDLPERPLWKKLAGPMIRLATLFGGPAVSAEAVQTFPTVSVAPSLHSNLQQEQAAKAVQSQQNTEIPGQAFIGSHSQGFALDEAAAEARSLQQLQSALDARFQTAYADEMGQNLISVYGEGIAPEEQAEAHGIIHEAFKQLRDLTGDIAKELAKDAGNEIFKAFFFFPVVSYLIIFLKRKGQGNRIISRLIAGLEKVTELAGDKSAPKPLSASEVAEASSCTENQAVFLLKIAGYDRPSEKWTPSRVVLASGWTGYYPTIASPDFRFPHSQPGFRIGAAVGSWTEFPQIDFKSSPTKAGSDPDSSAS